MLESSEMQCRICLRIALWKEKRGKHPCTSSHLLSAKDWPIRCLFSGTPVCTCVSAAPFLKAFHTTMSEKTWGSKDKVHRQSWSALRLHIYRKLAVAMMAGLKGGPRRPQTRHKKCNTIMPASGGYCSALSLKTRAVRFQRLSTLICALKYFPSSLNYRK